MNDKVENTKRAQVAQPVVGNQLNQLNQGQAEHEVLQKEVERIYAQYKALAEGNNVARAQKVYLEYQQAYDRYIVSYNAFADAMELDDAKDGSTEMTARTSNTAQNSAPSFS